MRSSTRIGPLRRRTPLGPLLIVALAAAGSGACATTGGTPRPFPGAPVVSAPSKRVPPVAGAPDAPALVAPHAPVAPGLTAHRFDGRAIAEFALGFRGVPYRLGGSDPNGFDCSGLVQYVFAQYGVSVPRVVEDQYDVGDEIQPSKIEAGDLIFFDTKRNGDGASHVGIAVGRDSFVHAPNATGVVRVENLGSSYWGSRYIGARRIKD